MDVWRSHENIYSHNININNRDRNGAHIRKGYGPLTLNALSSVSTKERVCGNLKWMSTKYLGSPYWTVFDGRSYRGVIVKIGWCAERGYAAKVLYKDGYAEWVHVTKVEESNRKEEEIKRRVQSNLKWMGEKFYGVRFPKHYMGKDYVGVVNAVRWIRGQGMW